MSKEENKKINLSNFLLLLAIIVIVIMGVCIFVLYKNIDSLNETVRKFDENNFSSETKKIDYNEIENEETDGDIMYVDSVQQEKISDYIANVWLNGEEYKENMPEFQNIKDAPKDYLAACAALGVLKEINNYYTDIAQFGDFNDAWIKLFGKDADGLLVESDIENTFLVESKNSNNTYSVSRSYDGAYFSGYEYIVSK